MNKQNDTVSADTVQTTNDKAVSWRALFAVFCDDSYYHMWAVRRTNETRWGHCYHLPSKEEAQGLADELTRLEKENELLRAANSDVKRIAKERDRMESALQVISTWATFRGGECLTPTDTENLCRRALRANSDSATKKT